MILTEKIIHDYPLKMGKELLQSDEAIIELIFWWCEKLKVTDVRHIAYILATIFHECAGHFKPIEEYGKGKGRPYGKPNDSGKTFYGRGLVQITWAENYARFGKLLGIDLTGKPELALDPVVSVQIAVKVMKSGLFTGKKLSDYFNTEKEEAVKARKIINGTDKAVLIGTYYRKFHELLTS